MNQARLSSLRQQLENLVERVRSDSSALLEQTHAGVGGEMAGDLSSAPMHLGDRGTDEYMYDLNATLLPNELYIVREAVDALRRIENDSYGMCEGCAKPIAAARLNAIPYARYCVRCAETNDTLPEVNLNEGRPLSPKDTLAPEGDMEENKPKRADLLETPASPINRGDTHAAGTAGGGTAVGGLAGSNEGSGDPVVYKVDEASASGNFDVEEDRPDGRTPISGRSGGAVGGTSASKRAKPL